GPTWPVRRLRQGTRWREAGRRRMGTRRDRHAMPSHRVTLAPGLCGGDLAFAAGAADPPLGGVAGHLVVVGDASDTTNLPEHLGEIVRDSTVRALALRRRLCRRRVGAAGVAAWASWAGGGGGCCRGGCGAGGAAPAGGW